MGAPPPAFGRAVNSLPRVRRLVVVLIVGLALTGLATASAASTGTSARAATGTDAIVWRGCGGGFQCGTLTVPVDAAAGGSTIGLQVIRMRARRTNDRIGSLVFNPGGPGVPGIDFLRNIADTLPAAIRDRFDLVSFDPRGVGASDPIECEDSLDPLFDQSFSPSTSAQRAGLVEQFRDLAAACVQRNGSLLDHVSTADTVRDLERLRVALGDRRLSYLGFSYGTYLGAMYASTYPQHVRAFVLDGPIDPTLDGADATLAQVRGFEHSLDDFLADCSAHASCAFHHDGDAAAAYDTLRARTARAPIPAESDPGRSLNQTRFDAAVLQALYLGRPEWPSLARELAAADSGDGSNLLDSADSFVGRDGTGHDDHALEAFWAISCRDGPAVGDLTAAAALEAEAARIAPRLGPFVVNNSLACSVWPVPTLPPTGPLEARGAPPILVIGTTNDPATPLAQAKALAGELERGVLLVARGEQHTSFDNGNECVDRAVTRYLVDRQSPKRGTRC
jgi:pimeloyl-ACP methyl ester carboxylesterase